MRVLKHPNVDLRDQKGDLAGTRRRWSGARTLLLGLSLMLVVGCAVHEPNSDDLVMEAERRHMGLKRGSKASTTCGNTPSRPDGIINSEWRYPEFKLENHLVVSDSDGYLHSHDRDVRRALQALVTGINSFAGGHPGKPMQVMFYFNGGLNKEEDIINQAAKQVPCILADGMYPVFFVWDTNGINSYIEQTFRIRNGKPNPNTGVLTGSLYVLGDVIEGLGRAPSAYAVQAERYFLRDRPCYDRIKTPEQVCADWHSIGLIDPNRPIVDAFHNVVASDKADEGPPTDVFREAYFHALAPVRLVTTPFTDGFGKTAWNNMLRRTRTTIHKSIEFEAARSADFPCYGVLKDEMVMYPKGTGAFAKIFQLLATANRGGVIPYESTKCVVVQPPQSLTRHLEEKPTVASAIIGLNEFHKVDLKLTLIGHSMGAIAINELIYRFPSELPYKNIVYMAAAASARDTRRSVEPVLKANANTKFFNVTLHPLNDQRERYFNYLVPSGSLLVWIDEMYEFAKTPEDMTFGNWSNARVARHLFDQKEIGGQVLYRVFNRSPSLPGEPVNPRGHGDFNGDEMCFWRPAFWGVRHTNWKHQYQRELPDAMEECIVPRRTVDRSGP